LMRQKARWYESIFLTFGFYDSLHPPGVTLCTRLNDGQG
jgi:hypothetical protein